MYVMHAVSSCLLCNREISNPPDLHLTILAHPRAHSVARFLFGMLISNSSGGADFRLDTAAAGLGSLAAADTAG